MSAVEYYLAAARAVLGEEIAPVLPGRAGAIRLELGATPEQERAAAEILRRAGVRDGERYAVLNPGANNPVKRWPVERFAAVAAQLVKAHGLRVLVNGGPTEQDVADAVIAETMRLGAAQEMVVGLPKLGITIGALKPIVRGASVMLTNDTGPRHIAAAMGTPVVTLFGPTDPRWTTLPVGGAANVEMVADPTLPPEMLADDHPERCRIERIEVGDVMARVDAVLRR